MNRPRLLTPAFALVWALTFITFFAAFQLFPTVPLRLRELGASLAESGRFLTVFTTGSAFGALFTGPLGDRIGQRRMVMLSALGFALCVVLYGFFPSRGWFYVLALPHGVIWSGLLTATMATLGGVLPPERRADGLALYGLASPGGVIFGPMVGLALFQRIGMARLGMGMATLFVALALLGFVLPRDRADRERRSPFQRPDPVMLAPCSVLFATALGYGALGTYTAQEALKAGFAPILGIPTASAFLTCMAIGMVGMRVVMTRVGFGARPVRMLPTMVGASAVGLALLAALPGGVTRHILAGLAYGAGYSMVHTLVSTWVLDVVHPDRRGAAFGATLFSFDLGIGLGSAGVGYVIGHLGYRPGWGAAALVAGLALPLALRLSGARLEAPRS